MQPMPQFTNDSILLFDEGIWGELGYGVPNMGANEANYHTTNITLARLVDEIGSHIFNIAHTTDARKPTFPDVGTLKKIDGMITSFRLMVDNRLHRPSQERLQAVHASPTPMPFKLYPCPYFYLPNKHFREWISYGFLAVTELVQHSDNEEMFQIDIRAAQIASRFIRTIHEYLAIEVLRIPAEEVRQKDENGQLIPFNITEQHWQAYQPAEWDTDLEADYVRAPLQTRPAEYDRSILARGIDAPHAMMVARYIDGRSFPGGEFLTTSTNTQTNTSDNNPPAFP